MKLNELARIVMPTGEYLDYTDLFLRKKIGTCFLDGVLKEVNIYKYDTWMNLFAAKKYYHYCDLGSLYLKLNVEGKYKIVVTGVNRNIVFDRIEDVLISRECHDDTVVKIVNAEKYEGLYFTIIESVSDPIEFRSGAWCTDKDPERDGKLAIVSCTFKREDFVTKNIDKFEQFKKENLNLKDKIYMFISDNGKSLSDSLNSENVRIYPNMNAGGAGGFTRGLMEVMKLNQTLDKKFTRVLFIDDDVEIFPESFFRTLVLSNYLKEERKDSFINGAMLDLYKKNRFFENLAVQNELWVRAYHGEQELHINNILNINDIPDRVFTDKNFKVDSAWWYHCFDISCAKEKGLPFPCFFRGDDVEWSWRNFGKHHISVNGICVWHAPFLWRVSKVVDLYYLPRNMFFLNLKYSDNFKFSFSGMFKKIYKRLSVTYDYTSLELLLRAMSDILKGSSVFSENPETQFKEVNSISKQGNFEKCDNLDELNGAKHHGIHVKKWRKFIYKISGKGLWCPKFLFKKQGIALDWYPPVEDFILKYQVKVYNLASKTYEIRKFDRKKLIYYKKNFYDLLDRIYKDYDRIQGEFIEACKKFSTPEFWTNYLELNKDDSTSK